MGIGKAIQQTKFKDEYQKAHINILYTASWLNVQLKHELEEFGISWQQFNILRILKGMSPKPASIKLLRNRMIDKMSNASRLVDKLVLKGFVARIECPDDRRQVEISITQDGLHTMNQASLKIDKDFKLLFNHISEQDLKQLNLILDKIHSI